MGSDPQSYLEYLDKHCDCAASRAEKGYLAEIHELREKLSKSQSEREKELQVLIDGTKGVIRGLYSERALLIAFLSSIFESTLEEPADKEEGFRFCLYMKTQFGQVSWHVADRDLHYFSHVPRDQGVKWDGHDSAEKEIRIEKCIAWLKERNAILCQKV